MNKLLIYILTVILVLSFISCKNNNNTFSEKSFHVWGNNEKCKAIIEKACVADGVNEATWDIDSKLLKLKIDTTVISFDVVLKSVASTGYDNELYFGNDYAYSKLLEACQYERRVD